MSTIEEVPQRGGEKLLAEGLREKLSHWTRVRTLQYAEVFLFVLVILVVDFWLVRLERGPHAGFLSFVLAAFSLAAAFTAFVYFRLRVLDPREIQSQRYRRDVRHQYETLRRGIAELKGDFGTLGTNENRPALGLVSRHVLTILDGLAAVTSKYVGAETAVSVKLFCLPSNLSDEPVVMSFARDTKSQAARRGAPPAFPYTYNTAFESIVQQRNPRGYFACGDLLSLDRAGLYKNTHEHWRRYYTSTLVVPICDQTNSEDVSLLGFLCIDSYAGDVTYPPMRPLIFSMADELYRTMILVDELIPDDHAQ